jgi:hypothetical protein
VVLLQFWQNEAKNHNDFNAKFSPECRIASTSVEGPLRGHTMKSPNQGACTSTSHSSAMTAAGHRGSAARAPAVKKNPSSCGQPQRVVGFCRNEAIGRRCNLLARATAPEALGNSGRPPLREAFLGAAEHAVMVSEEARPSVLVVGASRGAPGHKQPSLRQCSVL